MAQGIREGEVAVRYNREQIRSKKADLLWFCYDTKEARKIEFITKQPAIVLSNRIFEPGKSRQNKRRGEMKNSALIEKWLAALNGFTAQTAAFVTGVHYHTARQYLKRIDLSELYESLQPGLTRGRGIKLFIKTEFASSEPVVREALGWNLALHYLYEKGWDAWLEDGANQPKLSAQSSLKVKAMNLVGRLSRF